jgi:hypothetical protein
MNSDIGELHEARFTGTFTVTAVKSINVSTGMRKVLSNCIEYITMRWTIFGCMHLMPTTSVSTQLRLKLCLTCVPIVCNTWIYIENAYVSCKVWSILW